jgi:hypothetical protein
MLADRTAERIAVSSGGRLLFLNSKSEVPP